MRGDEVLLAPVGVEFDPPNNGGLLLISEPNLLLRCLLLLCIVAFHVFVILMFGLRL
jgi:hypothetical protein